MEIQSLPKWTQPLEQFILSTNTLREQPRSPAETQKIASLVFFALPSQANYSPLAAFFSVVYRWHNIITAKLSSIQSAICFSVMEAFTPSARCLLLIRGEPSGGRGGNPAARLRESEGVCRAEESSLPRATLVLSGCVSVGLHFFSSTSPLPLLLPLLLLLSRTCLPPHTSCTSLYLSHDSAAELPLWIFCEEFSWSGVFFKTSQVL